MNQVSQRMIGGSTKLEALLDDPYYIYPPRTLIFGRLLRLWLILFGCIICSIGPLTLLFLIVYGILYVHYQPLFRLWKVYYSKCVLVLMNLAVIGFCCAAAPYVRTVVERIILHESIVI